MNIIEDMLDPKLFGPWFSGPSFDNWRVVLKGIFAIPMTLDELAVFKEWTGRLKPPTKPVKEGWLICGRRSGKSRIMAFVGTYLAGFHDHGKRLAPGERALVPVIASDKDQAGVIIGYIHGFFSEIPLLKKMVDGKPLVDGVKLKNGTTIRVMTASTSAVRGYTIVAALCDEIAFWNSEGQSEPDKEILAALRPGMLTLPTSILLCGSSPYAKRGELYRTFERYYGKDDDRTLVWRAPTLTMNPSVDPQEIEEARVADPISASAEYDAEFRGDIEQFVSREAIAACTTKGMMQRTPSSGTRYIAFCDPAGGSGADAFTVAIAHLDKGVAILDATYSRQPPFSPEGVCAEFAMFLKRYGLTTCTGDNFGGKFPVEMFKKFGITYIQSATPKRDYYLTFLALCNSGRVDLLDNPQISNEFCALERKISKSGRETVEHRIGGHDDLVNSIAGALVLAAERQGSSLAARVPPVSIVANGGAASGAGENGFGQSYDFGGTATPSYRPEEYYGPSSGVAVIGGWTPR